MTWMVCTKKTNGTRTNGSKRIGSTTNCSTMRN